MWILGFVDKGFEHLNPINTCLFKIPVWGGPLDHEVFGFYLGQKGQMLYFLVNHFLLKY